MNENLLKKIVPFLLAGDIRIRVQGFHEAESSRGSMA
jgi:hypothetical protein